MRNELCYDSLPRHYISCRVPAISRTAERRGQNSESTVREPTCSLVDASEVSTFRRDLSTNVNSRRWSAVETLSGFPCSKRAFSVKLKHRAPPPPPPQVTRLPAASSFFSLRIDRHSDAPASMTQQVSRFHLLIYSVRRASYLNSTTKIPTEMHRGKRLSLHPARLFLINSQRPMFR